MNVAGAAIREEAQRKAGSVGVGDIVVTSAGAIKKWTYVFHGITRVASVRKAPSIAETERVISVIVSRSLRLVEDLNLQSIAFPAIGTGFAGYPVDNVAITMATAIRDHLQGSSRPLCVELWITPDSIEQDLSFLEFFRCFDERIAWIDHVVRSHAVILIHGIRTDARGFDRAGRALRHCDHEIHPVYAGYGFFDAIRFLLPFTWPKRRVIEKIEGTVLEVIGNESIAKVSLIAHSFGTYIAAQLLQRNSSLRLHRLILCGSVLNNHYPWSIHKHQIELVDPNGYPMVRVINDCGWRDVWPVLANFVTWGYGYGGRFGFQTETVLDRFHDANHSDFFEEDFIRKYWISIISAGRVVDAEEERPATPYWLQLSTVLKLPYLLLVAVVVSVTIGAAL